MNNILFYHILWKITHKSEQIQIEMIPQIIADILGYGIHEKEVLETGRKLCLKMTEIIQ